MNLQMALSESERKQLSDIEVILQDIKCGVNINDNIKLLARRHNVTKSHLQAIRRVLLIPDDLVYIEDLNNRVWKVLEPVYDNLTKIALEHMHQWYKRCRREAGDTDPQMYKYQLDLAEWLLSAIIKNELPEAFYTLLVSRGSGEVLPTMANL